MIRTRQPIVLALGLLAAAASALARGADNLIYVPVEPCRIVDTRESTAGPLPADVVGVDGDARPFLVSGDAASLAVQGGAKTGCLHPKADEGLEPAAIAAYFIAVPAPGSAGGVLSAFPADQPDPAPGTGSTVNFAAGQVIGNTTIVTLCAPGSCPADGQFAVLARSTSQHVVVDVQGYFYPKELDNVLSVSPAGGDYTGPAEALAALKKLTDANDPDRPSATNPYLVKLGPGVYELGTSPLQLLAHVTLRGAGQEVTTLRGSGANGVVRGANAALLRDLTVQATGGASTVALDNLNSSQWVEDVTLRGNGTGVRSTGGEPTLRGITVAANVGSADAGLFNVTIEARIAVVNSDTAHADITNSWLVGALNNGATATANVASSVLDGTASVGGGLTCAFVANPNLVALDAQCQVPAP